MPDSLREGPITSPNTGVELFHSFNLAFGVCNPKLGLLEFQVSRLQLFQFEALKFAVLTIKLLEFEILQLELRFSSY